MVILISIYWTTFLPVWLWSETVWNGFFVTTMMRLVFLLNATWLVNSAAHLWGRHPYDKNIGPVEQEFFNRYVAIGEYFHNFHHTFPWDYATSEFGTKLNVTTWFINQMAKIGWAYDLKKVSPEIVKQRMKRTGDIHQFGHYSL